MKLGVIPENLLERLLLAIKVVPTPIFGTQVAFMLARTIMAGTKLGIFEAIAPRPLTAAEIAAQCKTDPNATIKLLNALVGAGYLRIKKDRYCLTPVARKWLLKESPQSIFDKMIFHYTEWEWMTNYEAYVRTGKPLHIHDMLSNEAWGVYQRGMRSIGQCSISAAHMAISPWPSAAATRSCTLLSLTSPRQSNMPLRY
jgi:hypothetical protein